MFKSQYKQIECKIIGLLKNLDKSCEYVWWSTQEMSKATSIREDYIQIVCQKLSFGNTAILQQSPSGKYRLNPRTLFFTDETGKGNCKGFIC